MRICFISGGKFIHIGAYLDYFKNAGHDVHFISLSPDIERDVPSYNVGFGIKYSATEGKWKYPLSMLRARRLVRKLKPDIVHTHYATSGGLTGLVCNFHPTVVTVHGSDLAMGIKSRVWRPLLKAIFNHADCVNVVSQGLKDMVLTLGIAPEKIKVLTLGVDTEKFSFVQKALIAPNRTLKLVCTRSLEKVYDHPTIIRSLAILKKKNIDFHMTFIGDGTLMNQLKEQVKKKQLSDQVIFSGKVDNNKLPKILSEYDIYLSSSLRDGTSICLLEAMAVGLFPIVSKIKANTSWLKDGVNGLMFEVGDSSHLADLITQLSNNSQFFSAAIRCNCQKVVEQGNRQSNMKCLEKAYEELKRTS